MRAAFWRLVPGCAVLLLAACQGSTTARSALLQTDRDFAALSTSQGFSAAFDRYAADDVVFMPEQSAPVQGKSAVLQELRALPTGSRLSWTPQAAQTSAAGDLGYSWGIYEFSSPDAAGHPTVAYGNYLETWSCRSGAWRLQAMMTNPVPGPAG